MRQEQDDRAGVYDAGRELAGRFAALADEAQPRAPFYAALCAAVAADHEIAHVLVHAPPTQQMPVLLMAAIHRLLLDDPDAELGAWYPNLTARRRSGELRLPGDPQLRSVLHEFVDDHHEGLVELVSKRSTQTNEVGRCALFLPAFGLAHAECGPLAHLDVGASGGLNLNLDRYGYVYEPGGTVGETSPVLLTCGTRGRVPVPTRMPIVAARRGIDLDPIDVADDGEARWLEACVWPDQLDRFERLVAAIEITREHPVEVVAGDAVDLLETELERLATDAHPIVTNSWVLSYFTAERRSEYVATLERIGRRRDLTWVFAESPALVPELPIPPDRVGEHGTQLTMVRWRAGTRTVDHLAACHPHGYWLHWR